MGSSGPSGEILEKCLQEALRAGWQVSSETWNLALFLSLSLSPTLLVWRIKNVN